ncbi:hypothetical protein MKQ70_12545 [Chitinophaga sedimenti]|uniref:hypothetical protein n=1 Tax=Chitinophaga sedimenti TaxID=2033606 RepID=UPI0020056819|nr:hypothetical protein [Chitinophaga sedimenti]MCK7555801.1 hypothetical protein [Chitinophaga sedimenti]
MRTVVTSFITRNIVSKKVLFKKADGQLQVLDFRPHGEDLLKRERKPRLHFRYQKASLYARMVLRPDFRELSRLYFATVPAGGTLYDRIVADYNQPRDLIISSLIIAVRWRRRL